MNRYKKYSANGVPWPLNDWLRLSGKPTIDDIVELLRRWY